MNPILHATALAGDATAEPGVVAMDDDEDIAGAAPAADADWPLLQAIATGQDDALDELMRRHQAALFCFVVRYLGNETAARDAVQETFVRVFFKAGAFRPRSTVKTWIYSIALNICRDAARKRGRAPAIVSLDETAADAAAARDLTAAGVSPDAKADDADRLGELRQAIARLPDRLRAALVLCVLEQRSHKEAAGILRTTPKSVELRVYRAKAKLRAWLRGEDGAHLRGDALTGSPA